MKEGDSQNTRSSNQQPTWLQQVRDMMKMIEILEIHDKTAQLGCKGVQFH